VELASLDQRVRLVCQVSLVYQDKRVSRDRRDKLGFPDYLEQLDLLVQLVHKERRVVLDHLVLQASKVCLESLVQRAFQDFKAQWGVLAHLERQGFLDLQAKLEQWVLLELLDLQGALEPRGRVASMVPWVRLVPQDRMANLDQLVNLDHKEQLVRQDPREQLAKLGELDQLEQLGSQEQVELRVHLVVKAIGSQLLRGLPGI